MYILINLKPNTYFFCIFLSCAPDTCMKECPFTPSNGVIYKYSEDVLEEDCSYEIHLNVKTTDCNYYYLQYDSCLG